MKNSNFLLYSPGGENEYSSDLSAKDDDTISSKTASDNKEGDTKKPLLKKIHDALQDWSNDDQREQDFDDKRP